MHISVVLGKKLIKKLNRLRSVCTIKHFVDIFVKNTICMSGVQNKFTKSGGRNKKFIIKSMLRKCNPYNIDKNPINSKNSSKLKLH